jgi:C-terminal processing protease CtpA/Prc
MAMLCIGQTHPASEPATQETPVSLTPQERVLGLVQFYAAAKQHFAYFDRLPDLDWDRTFMDYLPRVEKEQSKLEYYRLLQRFAATLQDGHTEVFLPNALQAQLDRLPLTLDVVEGQWVVLERYPTQEILDKDIPPGSVILAIDGIETSEYFERNVFPYISAGSVEAKRARAKYFNGFPIGGQVPLTLRYPDGAAEQRVLSANRRSVKWTGALREKYRLPWNRDPKFSSRFLEDGILYVRYGVCDQACLEAFSKLIDSPDMAKAAAVILDLRGNEGGSTPTQTIRQLAVKPVPWYQCRSRWSISYYEAQNQGVSASQKAQYLKNHSLDDRFAPDWFMAIRPSDVIQPAPNAYSGPLVILTDIDTGSAAEDLAVMLHQGGRATIIGERSGGSTGQPLMLQLPGGGSARICTVQVRYADGREFVGPGVQPDVPIRRTLDGIAQGRDEVLKGAMDYLHKTVVSSQPTTAPAKGGEQL